MEYFRQLQKALLEEKEEDRRIYARQTAMLSVTERRENGMCWYPVAIRDTEIGRGDYLIVEMERTTHTDLLHQFRFGMSAALFSQHDAKHDRLEGTIQSVNGNRIRLALRTDELPEWSGKGKLGLDAVFDENSYAEMEAALRQAMAVAEKKDEGKLVRVLTGQQDPRWQQLEEVIPATSLNAMQQQAVENILKAQDLAIVHGPPGTGKTTTLVQAIRLLVRQEKQILVTAPSNAAVDLLTEKLDAAGLNVVRIGNPARVQEKQLALTLDQKIAHHASARELRKLRKQAAEYRDLAYKYKRSFGPAEREQRKALFAEARNISREVEKTEQYIAEDVLSKAQVITATLVGANHYTIRHLQFETVVIDEAGQALEPACWIPILKARKLVMAGDHCQLPPTIKSTEAAKVFSTTLMEKCVRLYPETVVRLEEQYRMHEQIMGFPSREFYNNQLRASTAVAAHLVFSGDSPLLFIDTAGCGFEESQEGSSISNKEEADFMWKLMLRYLDEARSHTNLLPTIALISPYRHQVELLREKAAMLDPLWMPYISINTIDSFQGQERDVVFISMTRSNADSTIGFLSDVRRMNVAMTRARKKLVVVGDSATLTQFSFYEDLVNYAQEQNAWQSAWELMEH